MANPPRRPSGYYPKKSNRAGVLAVVVIAALVIGVIALIFIGLFGGSTDTTVPSTISTATISPEDQHAPAGQTTTAPQDSAPSQTTTGVTTTSPDQTTTSEPSGETMTVLNYVYLRSAPNTETSEILITLSKGKEVEILGKEGEWYKVRFNGEEGYVYQSYLGSGTQAAQPTDTTVTTPVSAE
ncbi:MAG: SH3 domain-containing protein [Oscillospiraceae bacterium]